MDTTITNNSVALSEQMTNNVPTMSQPRKISLKELAQATEVLKKYIYQQQSKTNISTSSLNHDSIELAEQPIISSDKLQEEATLSYTTQTELGVESIQANVDVLQNPNLNTVEETVIATPVSTVIEPATEMLMGNDLLDENKILETNLNNGLQENSGSLPAFTQATETLNSAPSNLGNPVSEEFSDQINPQVFPEAVEIPALDEILNDINPTGNSYVAQSNMAAVNTDYNIESQETIPVKLPDGQNIGENMEDSILVTSPQSFGMM